MFAVIVLQSFSTKAKSDSSQGRKLSLFLADLRHGRRVSTFSKKQIKM